MGNERVSSVIPDETSATGAASLASIRNGPASNSRRVESHLSIAPTVERLLAVLVLSLSGPFVLGQDIPDTDGREPESQDLAADAIEPRTRADHLLGMANGLVKQGKLAEAVQLYAQLADRHPEHPDAAWAGAKVTELRRALVLMAQEQGLRDRAAQLAGQAVAQARARWQLAQFLVGQEKRRQAEGVYRAIENENPLTREWLEGPFQIAAIQEERGDLEAALSAYQAALEAYPERLRRYLDGSPERREEAPNSGYFANRARLGQTEREAGILGKISDLATALHQDDLARKARERLAVLQPGENPAKRHLATAAELAERARQVAGADRLPLLQRAASAALRALEFPPFVPPTAKPALAENVAQLGKLRWSHNAQTLEHAFRVLETCMTSAELGRQRYEVAPPLLAKLWLNASASAQKGQLDEARKTLSELIRISRGGLEAAIAHYGMGLTYQREALYPGAIHEFGLAIRSPAVSPAARSRIADSQFRQGLYREAIRTLESLRSDESDLFGPDANSASSRARPLYRGDKQPCLSAQRKQLRARELAAAGGTSCGHDSPRQATKEAPVGSDASLWLSFRLAQSYELIGEFGKARASYQGLAAPKAADIRLRSLAEAGLNRIDHLNSPLNGQQRTAVPLSSGTPHGRCVYMGENRSDRGDWFLNHGSEVAILCSMLSPQDIVCIRGRRPVPHDRLEKRPLRFRFTTGKEGERGRRWLSKLDDPGGPDLALWNPITFGYSSGVYDDYGEQLPPGPGDLILGLSVPDGTWRLSLAFANDHNYYESNRRYTIHLRDEDGRFLTGCDVEDFLSPVYKHFAVLGPVDLKVHVYRDSSLNTILSGIFLDPLLADASLPPDMTDPVRGLVAGPGSGVSPVQESANATAQLAGAAERSYRGDKQPCLSAHWRTASGPQAAAPCADQPGSRGQTSSTGGMASPLPCRHDEAPELPIDACLRKLGDGNELHGSDFHQLLAQACSALADAKRSRATGEPRGGGPACTGRLRAYWRAYLLERFLARSAKQQQQALSRFCDLVDPGTPARPGPEQALLMLSHSLHSKGELGGTLIADRELVERAFSVDRSRAVSHVHALIGRYEQEGQPGLGLKLFERYLDLLCDPAIETSPRSELLAAALGQLAEKRSAFVEAALRRLKKRPAGETADRGLATDLLYRACAGLGKHRQAAEQLERIIERQESGIPDDLPDPQLEKALAQSYFDLVGHRAAAGDLAEAEEAIEHARPYLTDQARLANSRYLIGLQLLRQQKDPSRAAFHFRHVMTHYPNTHWAEKSSFYLKNMDASRP